MMNTQLYNEAENASLVQWVHEGAYDQIIILSDANTHGFCVPVLKKIIPYFANSYSIVIPSGESNKQLDICQLVWQQLFQYQATKHTLLINVGGGMLSDLGGFVASIYKRGIHYINIPTTLLAMVDASLGGKTGIDFEGIKNAIGTFQHPSAVYINPLFLHTLPERVLRSGIAEMIKHALLQGPSQFNRIQHWDKDDFCQSEAIKESVLFKKSIVMQDEHDQQIRQTLNLGHTIGHAIESASLLSTQSLLHGEAVMLGLIYELMLSHLMFDLPLQNIEQLLWMKQRIFPGLHRIFTFDELIPFIKQDKKNNTNIQMSLLKQVGLGVWQQAVTDTQVQTAINMTEQLLIKTY
jgi:3-dehydroquinate synthase